MVIPVIAYQSRIKVKKTEKIYNFSQKMPQKVSKGHKHVKYIDVPHTHVYIFFIFHIFESLSYKCVQQCNSAHILVLLINNI